MALRQQDLKQLGINNRTSVADAFQFMLEHPGSCDDYLRECQRHNRLEQGLQHQPTAQWAAWFARHVITDHWPPAAELIAAGGPEIVESHKQFLIIMRQLGMIGRTTGEHALGIPLPVVRLEEEAPPITWRGKLVQPNDDHVVDQVEAFRRQRRKSSK